MNIPWYVLAAGSLALLFVGSQLGALLYRKWVRDMAKLGVPIKFGGAKQPAMRVVEAEGVARLEAGVKQLAAANKALAEKTEPMHEQVRIFTEQAKTMAKRHDALLHEHHELHRYIDMLERQVSPSLVRSLAHMKPTDWLPSDLRPKAKDEGMGRVGKQAPAQHPRWKDGVR